MPAQPVWFHRVEEMLGALRALESSHLDRLAVQKLFGVRERRARQLMSGLPALQVGNAVAVERQALIQRLENTAAGDRFQWEITRRTRLAEELDRSGRQLAGRRVRVPPAARGRSIRDLSSGIELRPGELRIQFDSAGDFAAKLLELSQAMANDWDGFAQAVEENAASPPRASMLACEHDEKPAIDN